MALVTVNEMKDYLGESGAANDEIIAALIDSSEEELTRATGIDWGAQINNQTAREACRVIVWLSFYGVRDAAKNTDFLSEYRDRLITKLQYGREQDAQV